MTGIAAYSLKALPENSCNFDATDHLSSLPEEHNISHHFQLPFEKLRKPPQTKTKPKQKTSSHLTEPQNIPVTLQIISFY